MLHMYKCEGDMENANEDWATYLRTGEVPKYVQDFLREEEKSNQLRHNW